MHPTAYQARLARLKSGRATSRSQGRNAMLAVGSTVIPGLTTTVGDRERVLEQLHTEFIQLQSDIFGAAGWKPDRQITNEENPIWQWWGRVAHPTVEEWQKFYADQVGSWLTKFFTDWSVYTDWQKRLVQLRKLAKDQLALAGHRMESPDPIGIPTTPWDDPVIPTKAPKMSTVFYIAGGIAGAALLWRLFPQRGR